MPKTLRRLLIILLWIIVLGGGFVVFWIRDVSLLEPTIPPEAGARTDAAGELYGRTTAQRRDLATPVPGDSRSRPA